MDEQFIEKVAQKLGLAVDRLQPLGETIIREYVRAAWVQAIGCAFFTIALLLLLRWCWIAGHKAADGGYGKGDVFVIMGIIVGIAAIIFAAGIMDALSDICAPTYYVLHSFIKGGQ